MCQVSVASASRKARRGGGGAKPTLSAVRLAISLSRCLVARQNKASSPLVENSSCLSLFGDPFVRGRRRHLLLPERRFVARAELSIVVFLAVLCWRVMFWAELRVVSYDGEVHHLLHADWTLAQSAAPPNKDVHTTLAAPHHLSTDCQVLLQFPRRKQSAVKRCRQITIEPARPASLLLCTPSPLPFTSSPRGTITRHQLASWSPRAPANAPPLQIGTPARPQLPSGRLLVTARPTRGRV